MIRQLFGIEWRAVLLGRGQNECLSPSAGQRLRLRAITRQNAAYRQWQFGEHSSECIRKRAAILNVSVWLSMTCVLAQRVSRVPQHLYSPGFRQHTPIAVNDVR
jgi:hypothetical protein